MTQNKQQTIPSKIYWVVFWSTILFILFNNLLNYGGYYIETPDGTLYLSVAQNFIANGHFIQTARPYEVHMVVPPGLPLFYTVVLGLTHSHISILIVQYAMFGGSAVLLARIGTWLCPQAPKWAVAILPLLFISISIYLGAPNPGMLLAELLTIFLMILALYCFLHPSLSTANKTITTSIVLFYLFLVRPATSGLFVISLCGLLVMVIKKEISIKQMVGVLLPFALIIGVNMCNNYRETGHLVFMENYSAAGGTYLANNPNTKTIPYHSGVIDQFADDYFNQVYFDETLTMHEKNELLGAKAAEFIKENLGFVIRNALIRYRNYFIKGYNWNFFVFFVSLVFLWRKKALSKWQTMLILCGFLVVTIIPAFGLYIFRYSVPVVPFYVLINGIFYCAVGHFVWSAVGGRLAKSDD